MKKLAALTRCTLPRSSYGRFSKYRSITARNLAPTMSCTYDSTRAANINRGTTC